MIETFQKYNELIEHENPYLIFNDVDSPYFEYTFNIEETNVWQRFSYMPNLTKQNNWNLSKNDFLAANYMLAYACLLELFLKDDLGQTFCDMFPRYCKMFMQGDTSAFFYDSEGNTIFHYDAINGKERGMKYAKMFTYIIKGMSTEEKTLKTYKMNVASIGNNNGISIFDTYMAN